MILGLIVKIISNRDQFVPKSYYETMEHRDSR
jgi:hypothetical protein